MSDEIEITTMQNFAHNRYETKVSIDNTYLFRTMITTALEHAARLIAEKWAEENFAEVAKHLNPEAIANLAVASAGATINETLNKKLPDRVDRIVERKVEVYQRRIFGGIERIP